MVRVLLIKLSENQAQPRKLDEVEVSFIQAIWDSISFTCSSSIFYLLLTFLSPLENESIFEKKAHLDIPFHNRLDFDFMKRLYVFRKISPTSKHTSDVVGDFQTRNSAHWWMLIVARRLKWRWEPRRPAQPLKLPPHRRRMKRRASTLTPADPRGQPWLQLVGSRLQKPLPQPCRAQSQVLSLAQFDFLSKNLFSLCPRGTEFKSTSW